MNGIVFGEKSQKICGAFRSRGHEFYSCDLQQCSGDHPEGHCPRDYNNILDFGFIWDLIIFHPVCTAMAVSGNHVYAEGKPKHHERVKAVAGTLKIWERIKQCSKKACLENPVSVIFNYLKKPQYVQPYNFGHDASKKPDCTCIISRNYYRRNIYSPGL